ncbi:urease accessory protein [Aquaspirillum sp. LM1]|uniref:HupE/UreJ family protein n=1 Tax=Aquaspirillum sp. LM1 TaxID=1938604 RepID=UPI000983FB88|nr:HupE/UreJ family protein [Aquaspirillum sp. LM1]AQR64090.1 urease accessory protein [Aquaspirillum sp. LM1]
MGKFLLFFPLALASHAALAHSGHDSATLFAGFSHPLGGLDHLLAMLAIGLWAGQQGGAARWQAPLSFVLLLALGGALGMAGLALPGVEGGIAASVLVLGLLVAGQARLPRAVGLALAGGFALLHGLAHGAEMPLDGSPLAYAAGFVLASACLHLIGLGVSLPLQRLARALGAAIAVAGAGLLFGLV